MRNWRYYELGTGLFTPNTYASNHSDPPQMPAHGAWPNPPPNWRALRVEGDELVAYRPPAPSPEHEWDEALGMWRLTAAAAERARERASAQARVEVLEAKQPRVLREIALGDPDARQRLQAIEDEIAGLRWKLART